MNLTSISNLDPSSSDAIFATSDWGFQINLHVTFAFTFAVAAAVSNGILLPYYFGALVGIKNLMYSPLALMKVVVAVGGIVIAMSYVMEALALANSHRWALCDTFNLLQFPHFYHPLFCASSIFIQAIYLYVKILTNSQLTSFVYLTWMLAIFPWPLSIYVIGPIISNNLQVDPVHCWTRFYWTSDQWIQLYVIAWIIPLGLVLLASIIIFLLRRVTVKSKTQHEYKPLEALTSGHQRIEVKQREANGPDDHHHLPKLPQPEISNVDDGEKCIGWKRSDLATNVKAGWDLERQDLKESVVGVDDSEQVWTMQHLPEYQRLLAGDPDCDDSTTDDDTMPTTETTFTNLTTIFTSFHYVSLIFTASLLPHASYYLYLVFHLGSANQTLIQVFHWLMHVYPCVIPLIWIRDVV